MMEGPRLEAQDKRMKQKLEFMYNFTDYDNDRVNIREKYLKEMNKKTSLQDIGETLDELVLDNK